MLALCLFHLSFWCQHLATNTTVQLQTLKGGTHKQNEWKFISNWSNIWLTRDANEFPKHLPRLKTIHNQILHWELALMKQTRVIFFGSTTTERGRKWGRERGRHTAKSAGLNLTITTAMTSYRRAPIFFFAHTPPDINYNITAEQGALNAPCHLFSWGSGCKQNRDCSALASTLQYFEPEV